MELIEKVARGMCSADPEVRMGDPEGVVEQRVDVEWPHYVPQAKAAIRAMLDGVEPAVTIDDPNGAAPINLYSLDALKEAI